MFVDGDLPITCVIPTCYQRQVQLELEAASVHTQASVPLHYSQLKFDMLASVPGNSAKYNLNLKLPVCTLRLQFRFTIHS
jgi:hypothetical protein